MNRTIIAALFLGTTFGLAACDVDTTDSGSLDSTEISATDGGEVEVYRSARTDKYDFRLEAKNGQILVHSGQGYERIDGAIHGALSLKENGAEGASYELVPASNNPEGLSKLGWFFRVKAANGATLAYSEVYSTKGNAKQGAEATLGYLKGDTKVDMWSDQCGFELFEGEDGKSWFRMRAKNGEKLLTSQGYASEQGAKKGIDTVVTIAILAVDRVVDKSLGESMGNTERFEIYEANVSAEETQRWGWRLVAANNEIVAHGGELFSDKQAAIDSLELVRTHAFDEAACWTARNDSELPSLVAETLAEEEEVGASLPTYDPTFTTFDLVSEATDGGEVEIYRSNRSGKYDFRLEAKNGDILLQSGQRYERADAAIAGALSLKKNGQNADLIELAPDASNREGSPEGAWYFRVKAENGAVLGFSQSYADKYGAIDAAETLMGYLLGDTKADLWMDQCGFELYTGADDDVWFRLRAKNGENILRSQGYATEAGAKTGIDTVVTTAVVARDAVADLTEGDDMSNTERFEVYEANVDASESERFGWRLVAANNEIVASGGELFSSKQAAIDSLELVREHSFDEIACWTARNDEALPSLTAESLAAEHGFFAGN